MLVFYVTEPVRERSVAPIDWAGAGLLTAGMSSLLWVVLDGSHQAFMVNALLLGGSGVVLVLFVIRERHAADPILPLDLMTRPVIASSLVGSFLFGGILFGLDTYIPLYVQGVRGGNATLAGQALMPFFLAWAVSVALAARAVVHRGFRWGGMMGSGVVVLGTLALVAGASFPDWSRVWFLVGLAVAGTGMGPTSLSFILAVQHEVSWGQRGVATGAATFLRTIGGAIGVGLLGATLFWGLGHRLKLAAASEINVVAALRPETHKNLGPGQLQVVQTNLGLTLRDVYLQITLMAAGSLICSLWLPNKQATLAHSKAQRGESLADEGLAVAASEL
jgi:hypothetical protein